MPLSEEERRRCCILGGCGCGSGGAEQRAALRGWLLEKLEAYDNEFNTQGFSREDAEKSVESWLDELFEPVPKE